MRAPNFPDTGQEIDWQQFRAGVDARLSPFCFAHSKPSLSAWLIWVPPPAPGPSVRPSVAHMRANASTGIEALAAGGGSSGASKPGQSFHEPVGAT